MIIILMSGIAFNHNYCPNVTVKTSPYCKVLARMETYHKQM